MNTLRGTPSANHRNTGHRPPLVVLLPSLGGGGAERVAATLLPHLATTFAVTLVLLQDQRAYPIPASVPVRVLSGVARSAADHILRIPVQTLRLVRLVRGLGRPLVLSFMEQANLLNLFAARFTGHRAIVSQRTDPMRQYRDRGLLGRTIVTAAKALYPKAARVLAVSEGVGQTVGRLYRVAEERITVIQNPVDIEHLQTESMLTPEHPIPQPCLLHVGRLHLRTKAQDVLLEAFQLLRAEYPDLHLVLLGEGPNRAAIETLICRHGLAGSVHLLGWQANVAAYMARAKILVLCSRHEGWPNVLVEAMACGCPVVAADCPHGPREILGDGKFGLLVPTDDARALAGAIRKVLSASALETQLREGGPLRADEFSVEKIGARYRSVLSPGDKTLQARPAACSFQRQHTSRDPGYASTGKAP